MVNRVFYYFFWTTRIFEELRTVNASSSDKIVINVLLYLFVRVEISDELNITAIDLPLEPMLERFIFLEVRISYFFENVPEPLDLNQLFAPSLFLKGL